MSKKEFSSASAGQSTGMVFRIRDFVREKPKLIFKLMVGFIVFSILLTTALELSREPAERKRPQPRAGLSEGFSGVTGGITSLMDVMQLKKEIASLLEKDSLSHADSLKLLEAFERLEMINKQLNSHRK
ncbi:MAG: hypothetical protein AB2L20_07545 [Mangrovibacterium sp.]